MECNCKHNHIETLLLTNRVFLKLQPYYEVEYSLMNSRKQRIIEPVIVLLLEEKRTMWHVLFFNNSSFIFQLKGGTVLSQNSFELLYWNIEYTLENISTNYHINCINHLFIFFTTTKLIKYSVQKIIYMTHSFLLLRVINWRIYVQNI